MADVQPVSIQKQVGEKVQCHCATCKRPTNHVVICSAHEETFFPHDNDGPYSGGTTYTVDHQLVECQGCNSVRYRSYGDDGDGYPYIRQFPPPPPDIEVLRDAWRLPPEVRRIHSETIGALENGYSTLAGIGIRLLIECVCRHEGVEKKNLAEAIDALAEKGVVVNGSAKILHLLRVLGNEAAHQAKAHSTEQLNLALDIVQTVLKNVYLHPHQAATFEKKQIAPPHVAS